MFNYDNTDYEEEKAAFILEVQQKVWNLFLRRYTQDDLMSESEILLRVADIVEEWTGHPLELDVQLPPRPTENIRRGL